MSGFEADPVALWAAGHQLTRVADDLDCEVALARARVSRLLDGSWAGAAASAYGVAWREWEAGFAQALSALDAMARLLVETGSTYDHAEATTRGVVLESGGCLR